MQINKADVAELVDARDLKCLATSERSHLFGKRDLAFGVNLLERSEIWKHFWGPLMALTFFQLLAKEKEATASDDGGALRPDRRLPTVQGECTLGGDSRAYRAPNGWFHTAALRCRYHPGNTVFSGSTVAESQAVDAGSDHSRVRHGACRRLGGEYRPAGDTGSPTCQRGFDKVDRQCLSVAAGRDGAGREAAADLYGRRRIFLLGLAVFTTASIACGVSPNITALVVSRAIQGIGAALLTPASLAMLGRLSTSTSAAAQSGYGRVPAR